jgi:transcriptional regulator with XRE-family HTH domain
MLEIIKMKDTEETMKRTPLKERLNSINMSQNDLAQRCGVSSVQVSKWANGHAAIPTYAESILSLIESSGNDVYMGKLTQLANLLSDGHYTIFKFTTNYRVGLGTPVEREDIDNMAEGKTLNEAIKNLLKRFQDLAWK